MGIGVLGFWALRFWVSVENPEKTQRNAHSAEKSFWEERTLKKRKMSRIAPERRTIAPDFPKIFTKSLTKALQNGCLRIIVLWHICLYFVGPGLVESFFAKFTTCIFAFILIINPSLPKFTRNFFLNRFTTRPVFVKKFPSSCHFVRPDLNLAIWKIALALALKLN